MMKTFNNDLSTIISISGSRIKNDTILKKQKENKEIDKLIILKTPYDTQNIFGTFEYLEI